MIKCSCGGSKGIHELGSRECYREYFKGEIVEYGNEWLVDGQLISDYTLHFQRGIWFHGDGIWSVPKDGDSVNSMGDE